MKTIYEKLKNEAHNLPGNKIDEKVSEFVDFLINQQDTHLLDVSKSWKGRGTWQSVCFANKYHYGEELENVLNKAINGRITHDEEKDFTLEEFRQRINDEIFEIIYHYEPEEDEG